MVYPVKIYDGEGNYVRTVDPVIDYGSLKQVRKFQAHPCAGCQDRTTNKKYCSVCTQKRKDKSYV